MLVCYLFIEKQYTFSASPLRYHGYFKRNYVTNTAPISVLETFLSSYNLVCKWKLNGIHKISFEAHWEQACIGIKHTVFRSDTVQLHIS
jgi:hypothetical protein